MKYPYNAATGEATIDLFASYGHVSGDAVRNAGFCLGYAAEALAMISLGGMINDSDALGSMLLPSQVGKLSDPVFLLYEEAHRLAGKLADSGWYSDSAYPVAFGGGTPLEMVGNYEKLANAFDAGALSQIGVYVDDLLRTRIVDVRARLLRAIVEIEGGGVLDNGLTYDLPVLDGKQPLTPPGPGVLGPATPSNAGLWWAAGLVGVGALALAFVGGRRGK